MLYFLEPAVPTIKTNGNQSPESFGDSHSNPSLHSETYIGPPPPLPQMPHGQSHQLHQPIQQIPAILQHQPVLQHQPIPPHQPLPPPQPLQPPQALQSIQPLPPPQPPHLAKATQHFGKVQIFRNKPFMQNKPTHLMQGLPPHQLIPNQGHLNRIRSHQIHTNKDAGRPIRPHVIPINHVIPTPNIPNVNIPTPMISTTNVGNTIPNANEMHKYVLNNVAGNGNDIIEIQRIPEVFSTDLPPVHIYQAPQEIVSFTAATIEPTHTYRPPQDIDSINQFPEVVESVTGQPLFVNIQPSQMAKVVIPHGSSSALIFGGVQEMHKTGEYFDDPSYPNVNDQVISIHSKPSIAVTKNINADVSDLV